MLVLGGVHGNEPGSWLATEEIAEWQPLRGSLIVIPRANIVATRLGERTLPELGDLNRLYPGSDDAELPMSRMAAQIVEAAQRYGASLVLDLHESWGFYVERGSRTAARRSSVRRSPVGRVGTASRSPRASLRTSTRRWRSNAIT